MTSRAANGSHCEVQWQVGGGGLLAQLIYMRRPLEKCHLLFLDSLLRHPDVSRRVFGYHSCS
jgi:hypothetical protein